MSDAPKLTQKSLSELESPPMGMAWHVITPTGGHTLGLNAKKAFDRTKAWSLEPKGTKVRAEVYYGPSDAKSHDIRERCELRGVVDFTAPGTE